MKGREVHGIRVRLGVPEAEVPGHAPRLGAPCIDCELVLVWAQELEEGTSELLLLR